jgi:hypothetical protein
MEKPEGRTSKARSKYAMANDLDRSWVIFWSDREMWFVVATTSSTGILYHHIQRHGTF